MIFSVLIYKFLTKYSIKVTKTQCLQIDNIFDDFDLLSRFFDDLKVANLTIKSSPQQLNNINLPVFTRYSDSENLSSTILITNFQNGQLSYYKEDKAETTEAVEEFIKKWSGVVLMLAPDTYSSEPNYKENLRQERLQTIEKWNIFGVIILLLLPNNLPVLGFYWALLLGIKWLYALGVWVSVLLLQTEYGQAPVWVQKLCGPQGGTKTTNCNAVTQSSGGKLFGWLGWSEIGFVYFLGGFLSVLVSHGVVALWLSFAALLFVPYSLYYQAFVVKQWCKLCLAIQAIFIALALAWFYAKDSFQIDISIANLYGFGISLAVWLVFKPLWEAKQKGKATDAALVKLKSDTGLFQAMLQAQPLTDVQPLPHEYQIGTIDAPVVVTMVSNPHCNPCKDAYKELTEWQTYFSDEMQLRIRHINSGEEKYQSHEAWASEVGIEFTPTIFINGRKLVEPYNYKDIRFHVRMLAEVGRCDDLVIR